MLQHKSAVTAVAVAQRRAPQCWLGVNVTFQSRCEKLSHQSSSITREKPRFCARSPTPTASRRFSAPAICAASACESDRNARASAAQDQWRQVADFRPARLIRFSKKASSQNSVNQHVQIVELDQERGVADPRDGHCRRLSFGKIGWRGWRCAASAMLPDEFLEKRARLKCLTASNP